MLDWAIWGIEASTVEEGIDKVLWEIESFSDKDDDTRTDLNAPTISLAIKSGASCGQNHHSTLTIGQLSERPSGVLWDLNTVLKILREHDWKVAIDIAVSLWDNESAVDQLSRLGDAITNATCEGLLEGSTIYCDNCEVMRWINEGTFLPDPWFCPYCLFRKDAAVYGTCSRPSARGKSFLFEIKKFKVKFQVAKIIMQAMVDQDADDDDLSSEEDGSHTTSCQSVDGTNSTLPKREFSEMDPGVEGNLVVWPPLKGIVTYDESFEVANVKPIKATELQEIDIEWWVQQDRFKKKSRRHKSRRRRTRRKTIIFIPFYPRKARSRERRRGEAEVAWPAQVKGLRRRRVRRKRKRPSQGSSVPKTLDSKDGRRKSRYPPVFLSSHCILVCAMVLWRVAAMLSSHLVRGRLG
jgi:hypothetical protein